MPFVYMTLLVSALIGATAGLGILLNVDLHKVAAYLTVFFFTALAILLIVEYRRREVVLGDFEVRAEERVQRTSRQATIGRQVARSR